jgi:hypothetical protein
LLRKEARPLRFTLYAKSVRQAKILPLASFRATLANDSFSWLAVPMLVQRWTFITKSLTMLGKQNKSINKGGSFFPALEVELVIFERSKRRLIWLFFQFLAFEVEGR